jgi:hypothetical protein
MNETGWMVFAVALTLGIIMAVTDVVIAIVKFA